VRGIASQPDAALAVCRGLARNVGVARAKMQYRKRHIGAGNVTQSRFQRFQCQGVLPRGCAAIEFDNANTTRQWPVHVHAIRRNVPSRTQLLRIGKVRHRNGPGQFRIRAGKLESSALSHGTAPSIAADQPIGLDGLFANMNGYALIALRDIRYGCSQPHLHT
jgi:hypothetical protein